MPDKAGTRHFGSAASKISAFTVAWLWVVITGGLLMAQYSQTASALSVFGVLAASSWRWIEHVGWGLFDDAIRLGATFTLTLPLEN